MKGQINTALDQLREAAISGDETAMRALLELGGDVITAVHDVWFTEPSPRNPFSKGPIDSRLAVRRRSLLSAMRSAGYVPGLAPIAHSVWNERADKIQEPAIDNKVKAGRLARQQQFAAALKEHELAGRGRLGRLRYVLQEMFIPLVDDAKAGLWNDPELAALPPLTPKTATVWAKAAKERAWQKQRDAICTPGTAWHVMADSGHKKFKRTLASYDKTTNRMVKALRKAGEPDRAKLRMDTRKMRRAELRPVDADLKNGLYDGFLRVLEAMAVGR